MPRNQLYQVRDGKTYRECDNLIYILDGIATNVQKGQLSSWLKSHHTSGSDLPEPWYIETDPDVEREENIRKELERTELVWDNIVSEFPDTTVEKVEEEVVKRVCIKPVIYNIKQVPDDRKRTGYREYRRL